ncbi:MAG: hypothetical protein BWY71_00843 [Planctomycetes bacterium ADurb.Bin412]|nr:MAG: hypothetical protein BWY71_00843 [Planctomycetes bacterium ADurb.Bin412]
MELYIAFTDFMSRKYRLLILALASFVALC